MIPGFVWYILEKLFANYALQYTFVCVKPNFNLVLAVTEERKSNQNHIKNKNMGLFSFFRKKDDKEIINKMIAFSTQALGSASSEIEQNGTFLPFGAVLTTERALQLIVYHDPEVRSIDPKEHATIIQNIIAKRYQEPNYELCHMAFDGISHLPSGDIDSINVRVSHKPTNTHRIFSYPYKIEEGKIQIQNIEHPIINNV